MAQPTTIEANGAPTPDNHDTDGMAVPGKRKRDVSDDGDQLELDDHAKSLPNGKLIEDPKELLKSYFEVLKSLDVNPSILKRPLSELDAGDEPQIKRQKSVESSVPSSILDKVETGAYTRLEDLANDVGSAVKSAVSELEAPSNEETEPSASSQIVHLKQFRDKALQLLQQEKAYPKTASASSIKNEDPAAVQDSKLVLSVLGHAPQERRLFSSLSASADNSWTQNSLPIGVAVTQVAPSKPHERHQTLGELFLSPRNLPPLQPPKQPKTQAKSNHLDFYHPDIADSNKNRGSTYFTTKLSAGYYLDYSNATPSSQTVTKQRERAQSLAGKKPSSTELEMSEMDTLFRGAFSSFAPCKDDSLAVVPSSVAGRMWWQGAGQRNFQNLIEVEYYGDVDMPTAFAKTAGAAEVDEEAVKEAIDDWDEIAVDPSLEDAMGSKRQDQDKEADEILDEVSDLIETLASYQRIRNLTLPNSQNRQSGEPVTGDMLANSGPQPSEEELATYEVLKAQLALIIKTLPPFAVAKLNGDQLDDLLISTKIQVQTDQYSGVMEEDEAGVQARLRAQQQQAQATQNSARPPSQRTPSISSGSYPTYYQPGNQYATPSRTPTHPQQFYRPGVPTPNYQQARPPMPQSAPAQPRPQPNQYNRPNGFQNQYATQLAKAQTPYGHQNMPQFASQQRPQYGQLPQQGAAAPRHQYPQGYPQQPGTPTPGNYNSYTNGAALPPRNMSPQVPPRQQYSQSPNMQQPQRYGTPNQAANSQMNRFPSNPGQGGQQNQSPGLTGYHTVIPEAQQQRIVDQAKARFAAQERSALFGDKIAQPGVSGLAGIGLGGGSMDVNRLAAARANMANQPKPQTPTGQRQGMNGTPGTVHIPLKVTPVPVPVIPGSQQQRKPSS